MNARGGLFLKSEGKSQFLARLRISRRWTLDKRRMRTIWPKQFSDTRLVVGHPCPSADLGRRLPTFGGLFLGVPSGRAIRRAVR